MAANLSNALGGFYGGVSGAMGLLDALDRRNVLEQQSKRKALLFQQDQDDRAYDLQNLRPLRLQDAQLGVKSKQAGYDYNQQMRPLLLQGRRDDLNHNQVMRPLLQEQASDQRDYRRENRRYLTGYTRPRQQMLDERGDVDYRDNKLYQTWQRDNAKSDRVRLEQVTRPRQDADYLFNKNIKEYDFQSVKEDRAQAWATRYQEQKDQRNQQAAQAYQAAQQAAADGDSEAQAFYLDMADQYALPVTSALNGELGNAVALGQMAAAGEADIWNPDVQKGVAPLVSNTMKASGRSERGMASAGFMPGPNGGLVPMMTDDRGNLVPATRYGTSAPDDPVQELKPDQVGGIMQQQRAFSNEVNRFVDPAVKQQMVNRPTDAKVSGKQGSLVVAYSNGEVRKGGSRSWRNNNPGNIEYGAFAKRQGAIGSDGRFAVFPDDAAGTRAQVNLLKGDAYRDLSIRKAIGKYAPAFENDTGRYIDVVAQAAGVSPAAKISSLNDEQFFKLTRAMRKHEGYKAGQVGSNNGQRSRRAGYRALASGAMKAEKPAGAKSSGNLPTGYEWVDPNDHSKGARRILGTEKDKSGGSGDAPGFYEKERFKALIKKRDLLLEGLNNPMLEEAERSQIQQETVALDQQINSLADGGDPVPATSQNGEGAAITRLQEIAASVPDTELPAFVSTMVTIQLPLS